MTRTKALALVAVAAITVVGGYFAISRAARGRVRAIDAIPANAYLVISVDVDLLRKSPLGAPLFGGAASKLAGEKTLTELCGFDPLTRMSEVTVAVPEDGERGDFGIAVRADVSRDELVSCAKKVIESRQSHAMGAPTLRTSGSYTLVEADSEGSAGEGASHRYPTLAYRDGGPFLIGRGLWLATMIDTVEGRLPSARTSADHASLRDAVTPTEKGKAPPAFVVTAVLPKGLRERIKAEIGAEAEGSAAIMAGVLGVASVGMGITAGPAGGDTSVVVVLRCEDASGCASVEKLLARKRLDWSGDLSMRLLGVGPLVDSLRIENQGTSLHVTARAPTDDVSRWLDRLLTGRATHHPMPTRPLPGAPSSAQVPLPDLVLRPARTTDGGPGSMRLDPAANPP